MSRPGGLSCHRDGSATSELDKFRDSLKPLRALFGTTDAAAFGPSKRKLVRQSIIDGGLARTTINQRIGRTVHVFKWASSEELVPAGVYQAFKTVSGLPEGRSAARETEPITPVPDASVDAIRPHVARQVWAMIELQRLTGMRPGEVVTMRTGDIDIADPIPPYLGRGVNDRRNADVRAVLEPFFDLLGTLGVATLGVTHLGKSVDARLSVHKILGGVAYANLARSIHVTARDPENKERRRLFHIKISLGKEQTTLKFRLAEHIFERAGEEIRTSRVVFDPGTVEADATDLMGDMGIGTAIRPCRGPACGRLDECRKGSFVSLTVRWVGGTSLAASYEITEEQPPRGTKGWGCKL
jgi:hypothetical protein